MTYRRFLMVILTVTGAAATVSRPLAVPQYSAWSQAVPLQPPINSPFTETGVTLSKNGLSLYFSSNRPCDPTDGVADFNLWVAHRSSREMPWSEPACLSINADARIPGDSPYQDREPGLSRDQHWLYFASDRPGSLGPSVPAGGDIWATWRPNIFDDQGWTDAVNVAGLNTDSREGTPHLLENEGQPGLAQLFFSSTRNGFFDIWAADIVDGLAVGAARRVSEVNTDELLEGGASITHDGLEMFLFRGRAQIGIPLDLYSATRPYVDAPWSAPVNLGPAVNHPTANDQEPEISPDRTTLFFASNRPGSVPGPTGAPSIDIWATARTWGGASK